MEDEFSRLRVCLVGIQESQCRGAASKRGANYVMLAAVAELIAGEQGCGVRGGCELWYHHELQILPSDVRVLVAHDDMLIA